MARFKGFDKDEAARIRAIYKDQTGKTSLPPIDSFGTQSGTVRDKNNNRLYDLDATNPLRNPVRGYGTYNETTGEIEGYSPYKSIYNPTSPDILALLQSSGRFTAEEMSEILQLSTAEQMKIVQELQLRPMQLTDIPTSSTNASRPRTVAAGYRLDTGAMRLPQEERKGTVTVMFRDGTLWNYYGVPQGTWQSFQASLSKGPYVNKANKNQGSNGPLLGYPNGPADISQVPAEIRQVLWKAASDAQVRYKDTRARTVTINDGINPERKVRVTGGVVPLNARRKAGYSPYKRAGTNPAANNGKGPRAK